MQGWLSQCNPIKLEVSVQRKDLKLLSGGLLTIGGPFPALIVWIIFKCVFSCLSHFVRKIPSNWWSLLHLYLCCNCETSFNGGTDSRTLWCFVSLPHSSPLLLRIFAKESSLKKSVDGRTGGASMQTTQNLSPFLHHSLILHCVVSESCCNYWNLRVKLFAGESNQRHNDSNLN